ncbi:hypothetical protein O9G_005784 [Rozella allomycis CSF55]|uniref:Uncharacterized protein n=1 Tax=Rozella allomycis (strain CSF55) TaxID=988480 RepID=A0A075B435_ROZAC|nr:hypothetical protein O9G_005784 [Rozella allomycis CSF55]|eukprot:EPZ35829.1 hypothetical protein O9G_005784 [Rozella allomycis CSF55]
MKKRKAENSDTEPVNIIPRAKWSEDMEIELLRIRYEESNINNLLLKARNNHDRNKSLITLTSALNLKCASLLTPEQVKDKLHKLKKNYLAHKKDLCETGNKYLPRNISESLWEMMNTVFQERIGLRGTILADSMSNGPTVADELRDESGPLNEIHEGCNTPNAHRTISSIPLSSSKKKMSTIDKLTDVFVQSSEKLTSAFMNIQNQPSESILGKIEKLSENQLDMTKQILETQNNLISLISESQKNLNEAMYALINKLDREDRK